MLTASLVFAIITIVFVGIAVWTVVFGIDIDENERLEDALIWLQKISLGIIPISILSAIACLVYAVIAAILV